MAEMMVFARHTRKWEIAHVEDGEWWVRRDGSHICAVGEEIATHPLPPAPPTTNPIGDALAEAAQLILTHAVDADAGDEPPDCVRVLIGLAGITGEEWDFVRGLVATEWECNENPLARSLKKKLGEKE